MRRLRSTGQFGPAVATILGSPPEPIGRSIAEQRSSTSRSAPGYRLATQSFRIPVVADSAATAFGKLINRVLERRLAGRAPDFTTPMH